MKNNSKSIAISAIFIAFVFVSAKLINIPTPIGGVINISDSIILVISLIASRRQAVLTASSGAFLAEFFSPYAIFAPATLIIKGLVAFVSNTLYTHLKHINKQVRIIVSFLIAECIMILGYFIYQAFFLNLGVYVASLDIVNNMIQAVSSTIIGYILYSVLNHRINIKKVIQS